MSSLGAPCSSTGDLAGRNKPFMGGGAMLVNVRNSCCQSNRECFVMKAGRKGKSRGKRLVADALKITAASLY